MKGRATSFTAGLVHDGGNTAGASTGNTEEQRRRAVIAVAGGAVDAEECARLLDMLGLDPVEGQVGSSVERAS